jgi:hypothetical protein
MIRLNKSREHGHGDLAEYLANYADLQGVFNTDTEAATVHYISAGHFEGRTDHPSV